MSFDNSVVPTCLICCVRLEQETLKAFCKFVTTSQTNPSKLRTKGFGFSRLISAFLCLPPGIRCAVKAILDLIRDLPKHEHPPGDAKHYNRRQDFHGYDERSHVMRDPSKSPKSNAPPRLARVIERFGDF